MGGSATAANAAWMAGGTWMARRAILVLALLALELSAFIWGFAARACQAHFSFSEGLKQVGLVLFLAWIVAIRFPLALGAVAVAFGAAGFVRIPVTSKSLQRVAAVALGCAASLFAIGALVAGGGRDGACDLNFGF